MSLELEERTLPADLGPDGSDFPALCGTHWHYRGFPVLPFPAVLRPAIVPDSDLRSDYPLFGFLIRDWAFQKWDCVPPRQRSKPRASGIRPAIRLAMSCRRSAFHDPAPRTGGSAGREVWRKGLPLLRSVLLVTIHTAKPCGCRDPFKPSRESPTSDRTRTPTGPVERPGWTTSAAAIRSRLGRSRAR